MPAHHFLPAVAGNLLRALVPEEDFAIGVHKIEAIRQSSQHGVVMLRIQLSRHADPKDLSARKPDGSAVPPRFRLFPVRYNRNISIFSSGPKVFMKSYVFRLTLSVFLILPLFAADELKPSVPLTVPAGTPLRLYLTRKIPKTMG